MKRLGSFARAKVEAAAHEAANTALPRYVAAQQQAQSTANNQASSVPAGTAGGTSNPSK